MPQLNDDAEALSSHLSTLVPQLLELTTCKLSIVCVFVVGARALPFYCGGRFVVCACLSVAAVYISLLAHVSLVANPIHCCGVPAVSDAVALRKSAPIQEPSATITVTGARRPKTSGPQGCSALSQRMVRMCACVVCWTASPAL